MYYTSKLIQAKKKQSPSVQDGYWVHKDTDVKTYFGSSSNFITNGVMDTPPWILDAKEIKVCSGVTSFKLIEVMPNLFISAVFNPNLLLQLEPGFNPETDAELVQNQSLENVDLSLYEGEVIHTFSFYNCVVLEDVVLSNMVNNIEDYAFSSCSALTSLDLANVTSIGNYAFSSCSALTSVDLANVTSIGNYAFFYCSSLTSVDLANVTTIGVEAFYYCSALYNIDLGNKLTFIEAGAFMSISSSAVIISRNTTPPTLGYEAGGWNQYPFGHYSDNINRTFKVPSASVNAYKSATGWSTYANNITSI